MSSFMWLILHQSTLPCAKISRNKHVRCLKVWCCGEMSAFLLFERKSIASSDHTVEFSAHNKHSQVEICWGQKGVHGSTHHGFSKDSPTLSALCFLQKGDQTRINSLCTEEASHRFMSTLQHNSWRIGEMLEVIEHCILFWRQAWPNHSLAFLASWCYWAKPLIPTP